MVKVLYQQARGSLMYAMLCTRLDLAYPISVVSQHMANPSLEHWIAGSAFFDTCKAHCNSNYALENYHPKMWSDIVMRIGPVTLRIGDPP